MAGIQPGWGSQWETLANAISNYYGGNVGYTQYEKVVQMLNSGNYTMEEMEGILAQIPEFERTYNANGELIKVAYKESTNAATSAASTVAQEVNSNVANATQTQFSTVQTITKDAQTGKVTMSDSVVKYKTGQLAPTTMKGVAISAVQGVMAASAGITIGKTVNQLAYNHGFNWLSYAGVDMESLNPATWHTITDGDDSLNAKLFNMILGIDDTTKNPQMYMDENTFAYMVAYMQSVGVFNNTPVVEPYEGEVGDYVSSDDFWIVTAEEFVTRYINPLARSDFSDTQIAADFFSGTYQNYISRNDIGVVTVGRYGTIGLQWYKIHPEDLNQSKEIASISNNSVYSLNNGFHFSGGYIYAYNTNGSTLGNIFSFNNQPQYTATCLNISEFPAHDTNDYYGTYVGGLSYSGVDGIEDQTGARQYDPTGIDPTDIAAVLAALKLQFPELWEERAEVSPDGTNIITYIPVGFPTGGTGQMPTTIGATQSDLAPDITGDGDNATDELIKTLIDAIQQPKTQTQTGMESDTTTPTKPVDPNGDPRGTGENPPIIIPVGSASALWKIYNPSQAQLDAFGSWLWSSDFVDQLLKLFNDPMQAIIGLHKVYCTPPTSGSGPIKVGYLVSNASANYVSNQYTEIDCGSVSIQEHFNNAFDYDEFTRISIYLPFIGFKDLDVKDIMRSTINVKYGIDVLTGACLAKITVTRDLNSPILYTFAGNCAVQYPVSSGSYIGIITGLCSILGGVAGSIATGGALAPALVGATAGLPRMHATVEHSGTISANAGALGPKKPYIVIQRPQTHMPLNGIFIEGEAQNETVSLGSLTGYVKVKKADLMGIPATGSELDEIRDLLEAGIYMN